MRSVSLRRSERGRSERTDAERRLLDARHARDDRSHRVPSCHCLFRRGHDRHPRDRARRPPRLLRRQQRRSDHRDGPRPGSRNLRVRRPTPATRVPPAALGGSAHCPQRGRGGGQRAPLAGTWPHGSSGPRPAHWCRTPGADGGAAITRAPGTCDARRRSSPRRCRRGPAYHWPAPLAWADAGHSGRDAVPFHQRLPPGRGPVHASGRVRHGDLRHSAHTATFAASSPSAQRRSPEASARRECSRPPPHWPYPPQHSRAWLAYNDIFGARLSSWRHASQSPRGPLHGTCGRRASSLRGRSR